MKALKHDRYWNVVLEQYEHILHLYQQFATKRPVMLFDIQERRVHAYPYGKFAADLSEKSQRSLARQYHGAVQNGHLVVFIRDNARRHLVSFSVAIGQSTNPKP